MSGPGTEMVGGAGVPEALVAMWSRVLDVDGSGDDDDFFAAGGDALGATEVLSLVEDAFGVTVDLATFVSLPTPSGLAAVVEARLREATDDDGAGVAPVAFSQEGMLWHERFAPGSFNLPPFVRRYRGTLDVDALCRSLSDIVGRHAPLRTTFALRAGRPIQRIGPPLAVSISLTDLTDIDPDGQRDEVGRVIADAAGRPFDLAVGPLFEPRLFRLAVADHVLIIRLHHLVFDDWAVDIFRRELSILYTAHLRGERPVLPPLAVEFPAFCRRQRRFMAGPAGAGQLAWWRRELAGAPFTVGLPVEDPGRPRGSPLPAAEPLRRLLPPGSVAGLRALARRERTTLFMAMLTVFAVVVHAYTAQEDLLLASVVANRNSADVERLIACFTKKVLLRLRLEGDPTFGELLGRARATVLGALAHQDLSFETVVQEVLGGAAARHGLVPDVSVMFQAETPQTERLRLPGLTLSGFDTETAVRPPHFASGDEAEPPERPVWGGGLYRGTFLILSVLEADDSVSLVARGVFHPPAVEQLLDRFAEILASVGARPGARLSELAAGAGVPEGRRRTVGSVDLRGFLVEPDRVAQAIAGCPGAAEVTVTVAEDGAGGKRLVAHVVEDAGGPPVTPAGLRTFLWSVLPGYAWPASVVVDAAPAGAEAPPGGASGAAPTREEAALTSAWAAVLGGGEVSVDANYWQRFSFLEVLGTLGRGGIDVDAEQVRRNRTLRTLAADVAAGRAGPAARVRTQAAVREDSPSGRRTPRSPS